MRIHIALTLALAMILGATCPQTAARAAEDVGYTSASEADMGSYESSEGATAEVPYGLLESGAGSPTFEGGSAAITNDPSVETAEGIFPADRILAKEVYVSKKLGFLVKLFSNPLSGFAVLAVLALLAFMPWRKNGV